MRAMVFGGLMLAALVVPTMASAVTCSAGGSSPLPVRNSPVPPLYSGLAGRPVGLATPRNILVESRDEALALDAVLMRLRLESCVTNEFANYKPKTQFDNTPYRFNMEKGKKFNAQEFDAWMKSRGVRVASGKVVTPAPVATPAAAAATTEVVAQ